MVIMMGGSGFKVQWWWVVCEGVFVSIVSQVD